MIWVLKGFSRKTVRISPIVRISTVRVSPTSMYLRNLLKFFSTIIQECLANSETSNLDNLGNSDGFFGKSSKLLSFYFILFLNFWPPKPNLSIVLDYLDKKPFFSIKNFSPTWCKLFGRFFGDFHRPDLLHTPVQQEYSIFVFYREYLPKW